MRRSPAEEFRCPAERCNTVGRSGERVNVEWNSDKMHRDATDPLSVIGGFGHTRPVILIPDTLPIAGVADRHGHDNTRKRAGIRRTRRLRQDGPRGQGEKTMHETGRPNWAPARVTADHLRALTPLVSDKGRDRSVLVADRAGNLTAVTPSTAAAGCLTGEMRLLATRADLMDAGLTESWRAGRLTGPVVEVCTAEAASLNAIERGIA